MATKTSKKNTPIEEVPGYDLLIPIEELPAPIQFEAMSLQEDLWGDEGKGQLMGDRCNRLFEFMAGRLAKDRGAFEAWAVGRGAINRVVELGLAYVEELGKEDA